MIQSTNTTRIIEVTAAVLEFDYKYKSCYLGLNEVVENVTINFNFLKLIVIKVKVN